MAAGTGGTMSESPTEDFEHAEHAEHIAHSGDPFLAKVSITIAALAVLSAAAGSLETLETADTIRDKTTAAIVQNQATDTWGQFSRESLKKTMYDLAAPAAGARPDDFKAKAKDYETRSRATQEHAEDLEHRVAEANESSERHERRHQILTISATLLHISIAIATIAIVMRGRRWPFRTALVLGILGTLGTLLAFA
jgi:hypothetical protein